MKNLTGKLEEFLVLINITVKWGAGVDCKGVTST